MDAIDILGSLLGRKMSRPGRGTDVLTEIFGRNAGAATPSRRPTATPTGREDIDHQARELEDLLNVSKERSARRSERSAPPPPRGTSPSSPSSSGTRSPSENDRALILVRAMLNAAKSDGQIDAAEEKVILERVGDTSQEMLRFMQAELAKPLDAARFAASVPTGMEQQVYMMSLIAIDLDSGKEAKYLVELSNGLRLPDAVREQIHARLGAPSIY